MADLLDDLRRRLSHLERRDAAHTEEIRRLRDGRIPSSVILPGSNNPFEQSFQLVLPYGGAAGVVEDTQSPRPRLVWDRRPYGGAVLEADDDFQQATMFDRPRWYLYADGQRDQLGYRLEFGELLLNGDAVVTGAGLAETEYIITTGDEAVAELRQNSVHLLAGLLTWLPGIHFTVDGATLTTVDPADGVTPLAPDASGIKSLCIFAGYLL